MSHAADDGTEVDDNDKLFRWFTETQARSRRAEDFSLLRDYYGGLTGDERRAFRAWLERLAWVRAGETVPRGVKVEVEVEGVVRSRAAKFEPTYMLIRLHPRLLLDAVRAWDEGKREPSHEEPPIAAPVASGRHRPGDDGTS